MHYPHSAPFRALGASTFQGSLARPVCMVALLTLLVLLQGSLARPACRTALITLLTLFQGSLARPVLMVALLTLHALLQGSLARLACLLTLPGQPCSTCLHGSLAHPARPLAG